MRIRSGDVELRSFEPSLTGVVYEVRNHVSVRERMRDTRPIERASHERWVRENLVEAQHLVLFVAYARGEPVGITLLRNFRGDAAEIGVMIVDAERRRLVAYKAAHLVGYYAFEVLGLERLLSYVPLNNRHALDFNVRCGILPTGVVTEVYHELALTRASTYVHPTHRAFRERYPIVIED